MNNANYLRALVAAMVLASGAKAGELEVKARTPEQIVAEAKARNIVALPIRIKDSYSAEDMKYATEVNIAYDAMVAERAQLKRFKEILAKRPEYEQNKFAKVLLSSTDRLDEAVETLECMIIAMPDSLRKDVQAK